MLASFLKWMVVYYVILRHTLDGLHFFLSFFLSFFCVGFAICFYLDSCGEKTKGNQLSQKNKDLTRRWAQQKQMKN